MRNAIDRHSDRLKSVLLDDGLRKAFLKGAPHDAQKAVKAFVATNKENALKTRPKVCSHLFHTIRMHTLRSVSLRDASCGCVAHWLRGRTSIVQETISSSTPLPLS